MQAILNNLITQLQHLDIDINAEELADCLWLAAYKAKNSQEPEQHSKHYLQAENTSLNELTFPKTPLSKSNFELDSQQKEQSAELYTAHQGEQSANIPNGTESVLPFHTPAARALPHRLLLNRALRPLVRRIASHTKKEINEHATVEQIADTGIWLPVMHSKPVRWLELLLVIDNSPSMRLWHHTINELQLLFEQQGAFSDIRLWRLDTSLKNQQVSLHTQLGSTKRHYKELINPAQQRLILLVTDCISPAWQGKTLLTWLNAWAHQHPVSLINMLPQQLWMQSQLRSAQLVKLSNKKAAPANYYLHQPQTFPIRRLKLKSTALPIPLTTLEPHFLSSWSKFVVGQTDSLVPGFVFQADNFSLFQVTGETNEDQLFCKFRAVATPTAYQLICYLAAAPLRLPIMRLVQRVMLPNSEQVHLAEVFLSGLLKRVSDNSCHVDEIEYDFLSDGLRGRFLNAGLLTDSVRVQKLISDYIDEHYGYTLDFRAVLINPGKVDDFELTNNDRGFAKISATILSRLGGDYQAIADELKKKIITSEFFDSPEGKITTSEQIQSESPLHSKFDLIDTLNENIVIKYIGIGGAGGNIINHLFENHVDGEECICANTDSQALQRLNIETKIQLGVELTKGLGAGTNPEIGKLAAEENKEQIKEALEGTDMVFLIAGMGGGTGTGAISVFAKVARELGVFSVAVVSKPFDLEGKKKASIADIGIKELESLVDSLFINSNQKLLPLLGENLSLDNVFKKSNDTLLDVVRGITELIINPGLINVDFADVKTIMSKSGIAVMSSGSSTGKNRAKEAVKKAISNPFFEDINLQDATGILINIAASDMDLTEFDEIGSNIFSFASNNADMRIGTSINPGMLEEIKVTIFATGIDESAQTNSSIKTIQNATSEGKKQLFNNLLDSRYKELIVKHHFQRDNAQIEVLVYLQQLLDRIVEQTNQQNKLMSIFFSLSSHEHTKHLYIFGDVGGGKSMLMNMFYEACPIESKRYVHFYVFMQEMHEYIHQWRKKNNGDPLPSLASKICKSSSLLCIDEFHVTDIADAMLLARLFTRLFQQSVILVATSNLHPDDLYNNGLQRELFLPFISLLKQKSTVIELTAKKDYRLSFFKSQETTFYLDTDGTGNEFLRQRFDRLTNNGQMKPGQIHLKGRKVTFSTIHGDILFSSFIELCGRGLGPADYLAIAKVFNIILIEGIPCLSIGKKDQARRFVILVDALYEQKIKIICTIAVPIEQLFFEDRMFDFNRTRSRLIEMQSEEYFQGKKVITKYNDLQSNNKHLN